MAGAKLMGNLKDGREVYEARGNLCSNIFGLSGRGVSAPYLATPEQVALIRLDGVHNNWSRTSYALAKIKGKSTIITADSPYMNKTMARVAVEAHRSGKYPTLPLVVYEFLEDIARKQSSLSPEERSVHIMQGKPNSEWTIVLTPEMEDSKFLLKRFNDQYFKKFDHSSINFYDLPKNVSKGETTMNYLWFNLPQDGSDLSARGRDLGGGGRASGVLDESRSDDAPEKGFSLGEILDDEGLTSDFAPNQIKKIRDTFEQKGYKITRKH